MSTLSANVTSTSTLVATPARLKGLTLAHAATGGSLILRDDGAAGDIKLTVTTPAAAGAFSVPIPGQGIEFGADIHATLTDVVGVTVFYETY